MSENKWDPEMEERIAIVEEKANDYQDDPGYSAPALFDTSSFPTWADWAKTQGFTTYPGLNLEAAHADLVAVANRLRSRRGQRDEAERHLDERQTGYDLALDEYHNAQSLYLRMIKRLTEDLS